MDCCRAGLSTTEKKNIFIFLDRLEVGKVHYQIGQLIKFVRQPVFTHSIAVSYKCIDGSISACRCAVQSVDTYDGGAMMQSLISESQRQIFFKLFSDHDWRNLKFKETRNWSPNLRLGQVWTLATDCNSWRWAATETLERRQNIYFWTPIVQFNKFVQNVYQLLYHLRKPFKSDKRYFRLYWQIRCNWPSQKWWKSDPTAVFISRKYSGPVQDQTFGSLVFPSTFLLVVTQESVLIHREWWDQIQQQCWKKVLWTSQDQTFGSRLSVRSICIAVGDFWSQEILQNSVVL